MVQALTADKLKTFFHARMPESHKGTFGHVCLLAGSIGKMGAAVIAATSCLRGGCGLLSVSIPFTERTILQSSLPEAMVLDRNHSMSYLDYDVFAAGPAMGLDAEAIELVEALLLVKHPQLVLDADALTILSTKRSLLDTLPPQTIITPHVKEFDRLAGTSLSMDDREEQAMKFASRYQVIVVLKHHRTFITDGDNCFRNTTGNTGLAKGGSGDALLGLIASFRAQGYQAMHAAMMGVYLHGLAADIAVQQFSEESLLITDVIQYYGKAFRETFYAS